MNSGTIKFFNATKGFGFVTPDDGSADIFLPAAAVTGAGIKVIKPGQRITFEQAPDPKGPKVVSLALVGNAPPPVSTPGGDRVTIYCDANADATADILSILRNSGFSLAIQDYVAAPLGIDQLKRLSLMLSAAGQSLVHRYDPLFLALRLDDRFITDQDFWTAIAEHPALINGPILVTSGRARICKSAECAREFLRGDDKAAPPKVKTLSPRIAAMLKGEALSDVGEPTMPSAEAPPPKTKAGTVAKAEVKLKPARKPKEQAGATRSPAKPAKKAAPKKAAKPAKKIPKRKK